MAKLPPGEFVPDADADAGGKLLPEEFIPDGAPLANTPSKADRFLSFLKKGAGAAFDAYEGIRAAPIKLLTEPTENAARVRSALMGATLNSAPRILSAMGDDRPLPELQEQYTNAAQKHPGWNIGGAFATPNPLGKAGALARVAGAGIQGAASGYFGAPLNDAEAQDKGAGDTALMSTLIQAGMEGVAPGAGKLAGGLRTAAGAQAANAAGLRAGIVNQAKRAGIPMLDAQMESTLPKLGNEMLDANLIPFAGSKMSVLKRSKALMDNSANAQQAILTRAELSGTPFDADAAANAAEGRLASRIDPAAGGDLQTARGAGPSKELVNDIRATGRDAPGSFLAANKLKSGAYQSTNWSTEAPVAPSLKRETVGGLRESIEDQVSKALGNNEGDALRQVNQRYGLGAKTADFAEEAAGREAAHQKFGWGSLMLGATGAGAGAQLGTGGAMAGASLPILAQLAKTRGPAAAAVSMRGASKLAGWISKTQARPAAAAELASQLTSPKVGTPEAQGETISEPASRAPGAALSPVLKFLGPKVGTPEAKNEASRRFTAATGEEPKDKDEVARKYFMADGRLSGELA